jgi:transposase
VPDNLKSAVIKSYKYEPTLNKSFRDFAEHYKMTALPAGPYKLRHKALVEGAIKIIYQTIYTDELKNKRVATVSKNNYVCLMPEHTRLIRPLNRVPDRVSFSNQPKTNKL